MSVLVQYVIVGVVVALCVVVALRAAYRALRRHRSVLYGCHGCKLSAVCRSQKRENGLNWANRREPGENGEKCARKVAQEEK